MTRGRQPYRGGGRPVGEVDLGGSGSAGPTNGVAASQLAKLSRGKGAQQSSAR
uniref:Uncharacterized protein n=1 Tax=Oryza glaberrima TaxID=4538 RepID=I1NL58_ORYGL